MYKGGILGLISHIVLLILPVKELYKNRENDLTKTVSMILFCLFVMMNFEARQEKIGLYIILTVAYNIKHIIKEKSNGYEKIC